MKNIILIAFIAFVTNAKAQITLENTYDSASTFMVLGPYGSEYNQLMLVKFEISGERYVRINRIKKEINIYNINHILLKSINLANFPMTFNNRMGDIIFLSESLFDDDQGIEFMYCFENATNSYTGIYNEDGSLIFSESGVPLIHINVPLQQYPIYNTSQGTKMILSYPNGQAKVFSLPGTLSASITEANYGLLNAGGFVSNAYPNPAQNTTQIDYKLPSGVSEGEIVFYNLQGNEVKRFKVDKTFNNLYVSTSDIAAGTYYYQLQTAGEASEGKKMVVIK